MRRSVVPVVAAVVLAGCGAAEVEVAPAAHAGDPACGRMAWPQTVGGAAHVATSPSAPSTAAWAEGDAPAVVARCGVPVPGPTTKECLGVDDVDWIVERLDDGMRFTTYGRAPAIEVLVPDRYAPEPLLLGAFHDAAASTTRRGAGCS